MVFSTLAEDPSKPFFFVELHGDFQILFSCRPEFLSFWSPDSGRGPIAVTLQIRETLGEDPWVNSRGLCPFSPK